MKTNEAPEKIFVGITDGKNYSIVGENYPYAKEYVNKEEIEKALEIEMYRNNIDKDVFKNRGDVDWLHYCEGFDHAMQIVRLWLNIDKVNFERHKK